MRNITDRNKFTLQSKFLFMIGKVVKITGLNACCVSLTVMQRMRNITEKAVHACISRSSWQIEEFKFEKKKRLFTAIGWSILEKNCVLGLDMDLPPV